MSKVEDLIRELCPEGVKQKPLGELGTFTRGRRFVKDDMVNEGVPCIHYGEMYTHYGVSAKETKSFLKKEVAAKLRVAHPNDIIIVAAGETVEDIGNGTAWLGSENVVIHDACYIFSHNLEPKYVSYFLRTNNFHSQIKRHISSGKISSISAKGLEKAKIPVPPIEVQKEIVNILDKFTQLEAELEAELEARRKQYEYYRSQLLTFDNSRERVRWLTLGDIGKVSMCKRIFKDQTSSAGDVPFYKIGTFGKSPDAFITKEVYDEYRWKYSFPKKGDILLSASGTIGRTVVYDGKDAYFQDSNIIWIDNNEKIVTNKFLFHIYKIVKWQTEGGTIQRLYNDNLKKIRIAVPSIDEQDRIVSILDKFELLVNDISEGLPAEIKARRQQYDYYRTKLLTFQEATA